MRVASLRFFASLCLALLLVGCASSNKGKIVGKWECTDVASMAPELKDSGVQVFLEFTADQKCSMTAVFPSGSTNILLSATYQLGFRDIVTLENLTPPIDGKTSSKESINIVGDELRMKQEKGPTVLFKRVKESSTPVSSKGK